MTDNNYKFLKNVAAKACGGALMFGAGYIAGEIVENLPYIGMFVREGINYNMDLIKDFPDLFGAITSTAGLVTSGFKNGLEKELTVAPFKIKLK